MDAYVMIIAYRQKAGDKHGCVVISLYWHCILSVQSQQRQHKQQHPVIQLLNATPSQAYQEQQEFTQKGNSLLLLISIESI